tara:strand:- start:203 stop:646 length:444 start_codon:yes stop_codon:yes gene_type:complete
VQEYIISKTLTADYKEKDSRFHAVAQTAFGINEVKTKLFNIRKNYSDANHICYAYRIKNGQCLDEYSSDAGEPNGSAGKPILNVLKRNQIVNAVIFVIRYFGGTKLGIPGLIHAYGTAAECTTKKITLKPWMDEKKYVSYILMNLRV